MVRHRRLAGGVCRNGDHMESNEILNLEMLESRLEMESAAALIPSDGGDTTPICICHFW